MDDSKSPFVHAVRLMADEAVQTAGTHPDPDSLLRYSSRQMSRADRRRMQSHLAACPECAQTVLDLASFPPAGTAGLALQRTQEHEEEDWLAIRQRLRSEGAFPGGEAEARRAPFRLSRSLLPSLSLAAGLIALTAAGLLFWIARSQSLGLQGQALQANILVQDLVPAAASRNRSSVPGGGTLTVQAGMERVVLILNVDDFRTFTDYGIELSGEGEAPRWERHGLIRSPDGSFSVEVRLQSLPAGQYRIDLYGLEGRRRERLALYHFKVAHAAPSSGGRLP